LRQEGHRILLMYLQGQLFFGSTNKLVAALAAAAADDRVRFVVISMARVPLIDPSAARHLKAASERLRQQGCKVIFCRTNREVFSTLTASGVVNSPDEDLLGHLQNLRWKTAPMVDNKHSTRLSPPMSLDDAPKSGPTRLSMSPRSPRPFVAPFDGSPGAAGALRTPSPPAGEEALPEQRQLSKGIRSGPDAFCHETDALDYCDNKIVTEFCYAGEEREQLEPYMLAYRASVTGSGMRLPEWAFEDMNGLPRGLMARLQRHCEIMTEVPAWTKVSDTLDLQGALCFLLKGSLSVIQIVPLPDDPTHIGSEVAGFSFRQGKRLLKRYPPGHVAGLDSFFLNYRRQVIDPELEPKITVSSKLGAPAEIWVLRPEEWAAMDVDLKGPLTEMLCVQFADDMQHSRMQEH